MIMEAKRKAKELIEEFMNDTTAESYRKGIVHAIYHVNEILDIVNDQTIKDYYNEILEELNEIKQL
jgi:homoserine kinase